MDSFKDFAIYLATAILGGVIGASTTVLVNYIKVLINTKQLTVEAMGKIGAGESLWVKNSSHFPIRDVTAYLSIPGSKSCVSPPSDSELALNNKLPFISHVSPIDVKEGQLCWASTAPVTNPCKTDVLANERKDLCILRKYKNLFIEICSEKGFSTGDGQSRVFLKLQYTYVGILKVVSADTLAKYWKVTIEPMERNMITSIEEIYDQDEAEAIIQRCA